MDEDQDPVTPVSWEAMVASAKDGVNWWPPVAELGRAWPWEGGEMVYPVSLAAQLEAEVMHRLALLAPLVEAEDRAAVLMGLRSGSKEAAVRVAVALFPWGWPDECGAADWWPTTLGRAVARCLLPAPEFQGPMLERQAVAAVNYTVDLKTLSRTRQVFNGGLRPKRQGPWPYMRARVLGHLVYPRRRTPWSYGQEVRCTHRWLRRRLGLRAE